MSAANDITNAVSGQPSLVTRQKWSLGRQPRTSDGGGASPSPKSRERNFRLSTPSVSFLPASHFGGRLDGLKHAVSSYIGPIYQRLCILNTNLYKWMYAKADTVKFRWRSVHHSRGMDSRDARSIMYLKNSSVICVDSSKKSDIFHAWLQRARNTSIQGTS